MLGSSPSLSSPPGSGLGVTPPPFPPVSSPSPFGEGWEEAFRLISFARLCNGASALYFQESECWCPLKEDVKVDDGFGKLAF